MKLMDEFRLVLVAWCLYVVVSVAPDNAEGRWILIRVARMVSEWGQWQETA